MNAVVDVSKVREVVRLIALAKRMESHIWDLNDDIASVRLSGSEWLVEQHELGLNVAKEHLRSTYQRIGFLMVEGERSND